MRASFVKFATLGIALFALSGSVSAQDVQPVGPFEHEANAYVRVNGKIQKKTVTLKDLVSATAFDGVYFKVVKGTEEAPVAFDHPDENVRLRAATTYHYLSLSREAFHQVMRDLPEYRRGPLDRKLTVRIDQDKDYSEVIHFRNSKVRNGALSIAASDPLDAQEGLSWGPEIWFFVGEKVRTNGATAQIGAILNSREFKLQLLLGLLEQDASAVVKDIVADRFYLEPHLYSVALSFGLAELLPVAINQITKRIKQTLYVDTASIPEIAVHEYGHHALSSWFGFKERTHLVEGYPNYFAGKILGMKRLQHDAGDLSRGFASRRGDSGAIYSLDEEFGSQAATSSFTFSLLNDLDAAIGEKGPAVLLRALDFLDRSSRLKPDFQNAVMRSIRELVPNYPAALRRAGAVFQARGM